MPDRVHGVRAGALPLGYVTTMCPVLSIALPHEVTSERITSVVHPPTDVWMHHIELDDIDARTVRA